MDPNDRTLDDGFAVMGTDVTGMLVATRVRIRIALGPDRGRELLLERGSIVVGSGPGADLLLTDPRVSRAHAELAIVAHGVRVRDLGSRNGTFVRDARVTEAVVAIGTAVRVGQTSLDLASDTVPVEVVPRPTLGLLRAASPSLRTVFGTAARVAPTSASVLVEGEAGVGKTALTEALHALRGGAIADVDLRRVREPHDVEMAIGEARRSLGSSGTLRIEHVELATASAQRALSVAIERALEAAPGIRLLTTSREDLRERVSSGSFDRGLYFQLGAVRLVIPPLRDRAEDLVSLVEAFVASGVGGWPSKAMLEVFRREGMEGNARAVRGIVETSTSVAPAVAPSGDVPSASDATFKEAKDQAVAAFERDYLARLLAECDGNVSEASRRSGVARSHLVTLLKKHGLE